MVAGVMTLLVLAAGWGTAHQAGTIQPSAPHGEKTIVDDAIALWGKGDYQAALAEFEKSIAADADNISLHAKFANVVSAYRRLHRAAADKALVDLQALYARWMRERPAHAVYPHAAALLLDHSEAARKEALLLKAAALDRKLVEPYLELANFSSQFDDARAVAWAQKALEIKPADVRAPALYARVLWAIDQPAARKYYDGLLRRAVDTKAGALALQQLIRDVEDPAEKGALVERFRREFPSQWTPALFANEDLFTWYFTQDPDKGLAFAQEMLAAAKNAQPSIRPATLDWASELSGFSGGEGAWLWQSITHYAQAIVDAKNLIRERKGAEAFARLERTDWMPPVVGDLPHLALLRAEAVAASGDVPKAYEMLATELERDSVTDYQQAIIRYGTMLGKSAEQVGAEIWSRRLAKATTFKEFNLSKLGGQQRVKLSDLGQKVLLVDFWFPG
jgi:Tfp pilus assembly protein PilF